jgi:hypothetical protein
MNILVSTICFINRNKPGAEIYATFANRLIEDVMKKTTFDIMITTNEPIFFVTAQKKYGNRIIVREELLKTHKLIVGAFNQFLKFYSIKNIDKKYDWVLYLDCDAGFTDVLDNEKISEYMIRWANNGFDMLATRTDAILINELLAYEKLKIDHLNEIAKGNVSHYFQKPLFEDKFIFYNVTSNNGPFEWFDAKLPSEHVFLIKNDLKLNKMCEIFENFCTKFESQDGIPIAIDMEAFEIGVSAKLAGYNMGDFNSDGLYDVMKVVCNFNNWEKVKY